MEERDNGEGLKTGRRARVEGREGEETKAKGKGKGKGKGDVLPIHPNIK